MSQSQGDFLGIRLLLPCHGTDEGKYSSSGNSLKRRQIHQFRNSMHYDTNPKRNHCSQPAQHHTQRHQTRKSDLCLA